LLFNQYNQYLYKSVLLALMLRFIRVYL